MDDIIVAMERGAVRLNLLTPISRFSFGFSVASIVSWVLQPESQFQGGLPRPFAAWDDGRSGVTPTRVPWWMSGLLVGGAAGLFV